MESYLRKVNKLLTEFEHYMIDHVPWEESADANILAKLVSSRNTQLLGLVAFETFLAPSIDEVKVAMEIKENKMWMTPIKEYLTKGTLLKGRNKAWKLLRKVLRYIVQDGILYQRGFSTPLLRCIDKDKAKEILMNVY